MSGVELVAGSPGALAAGLGVALVMGAWSLALALAFAQRERPYELAARRILLLGALAPALVALALLALLSLRRLWEVGASQGLPSVQIFAEALDRSPGELVLMAAVYLGLYGLPVVLLGFARYNEHRTRKPGPWPRLVQYVLAVGCCVFPLPCLMGVDLAGLLFDNVSDRRRGGPS